MKNKIELLAPAGSMESVIAAINKGADAIYLGGDKFSARAGATNFDDKKIEEALDYCHSYNIPVYVTLNTLIKENEFEEAVDYVGFLHKIGVDGVIIQDTGILNVVRERYPNLEIHASTQLSIHNGEGALFFEENGFKRIVLSRELSIEEIEYISKDLGVETEVFVHGALCVSYSGQCLISSVIGGRSGNRGKCAQSCRLPFTLIREKDGNETSGYLLSPKDICNIEHIEALIKSGTASLKVEGRLKRPEYVAGVIESYRGAIDDVYKKKQNKAANKERKQRLLKLFNREGFSSAYLYKHTGKDMMAFKTPKNTGVYIGKVNGEGEVILEDNLSVQDGIRIGDSGFTTIKILINGKEVKEANKGDKVKILPAKYKKNDSLYKMSDTKLMNELKVAYEKPFGRKIELSAKVRFKIGMPFKIEVEYNGKTYIKEGEKVQFPEKSPLDIDRVTKNIEKSGEIPYKISEIKFTDFEDGFMPMSAINNLRRELLEEIKDYEVKKYKNEVKKLQKEEYIQKEKSLPKYMAFVLTPEQVRAAMDAKVPAIVVDMFGKNKSFIKRDIFKELEGFEGEIYLNVPTIIKEEFETIVKVIDSLENKIAGIVTNNTGIIRRFKDKIKIIGGYKLNIFNSYALEFYNKNIEGAALSIELNRKEIRNILKRGADGAQFFIYGKPESMVSEYCPIGSTFGGKTTKRECSDQCVTSTFRMRDRMNEEFVITTDIFCRSHIHHPVPVNLSEAKDELEEMGIKSFRLDFIDEDYDRTYDVLKAIMNNRPIEVEKYTKAQYRKGVL
ncbi:MAG: DUF3656 domain-containing U32 family peptidase [Sarcina sp.]